MCYVYQFSQAGVIKGLLGPAADTPDKPNTLKIKDHRSPGFEKCMHMSDKIFNLPRGHKGDQKQVPLPGGFYQRCVRGAAHHDVEALLRRSGRPHRRAARPRVLPRQHAHVDGQCARIIRQSHRQVQRPPHCCAAAALVSRLAPPRLPRVSRYAAIELTQPAARCLLAAARKEHSAAPPS